MPEHSDIQSCYVQAKGLRLHYLMRSPISTETQTPTLIFLHGFPEYSGVWHHQLDFFGQIARAIALDLPGYNRSEGPGALAEFSVPNLVEIVAEFIRQVSDGQPVVLVAHDWGGALAWPLAARYPELLSHLIILNAAHPSTFTREMMQNPKQRAMSDYIHTFLSSDAEKALADDDFALLKQHSITHVKGGISPELETGYRDSWQCDGVLTRMLNYYRAMPQLFPREGSDTSSLDKQNGGPTKQLADFKIPQIYIRVPTLVLWGEQDSAFDISVLDGLSEYIDDYTEQRFPDATHWLHHEEPEAISSAISQFLAR
ncbi:alpha/beta hydrolase [Alteromonas sp. ASW11-36]|uniref:Alpha/beta hydrolase n=1 Tax=Alteromonas arenosi TaxID=3055817 RepID=A0ABT7SWG4_9ALTE|nr:alpha/beta hydrolase [Alteromonas sp. ASW11-36]MDM7860508.1 alpha/beta hydrolase [Alteromonas sp. ASW11-36]